VTVDLCRTTKFAHGMFADEILSSSYSTVMDAQPSAGKVASALSHF
jgi:hypothetical protein